MIDDLSVLAGAYALDALTDVERGVFEEHLADCADCAEEVRSMQNAAGELSHVAAVAPPSQLRTDILAGIKQVRPLPPLSSNVIAITRARRSRRAVQFFAAACVVLALVAGGWGLQEHRDLDRTSNQASILSAALNSADSTAVTGQLATIPGATATVVFSRANGAMTVNAHGIAQLGPDKTYEAWLIDRAGHASAVGTFKPDASGNVAMHARADLAGAQVIGVTVEPAGGSAQPTGQASTVALS